MLNETHARSGQARQLGLGRRNTPSAEIGVTRLNGLPQERRGKEVKESQ